MELVSSEYFVTVPSSAPTRKKSLDAATAKWVSVLTSITGGSSSELCGNVRRSELEPTVTSFLPFFE